MKKSTAYHLAQIAVIENSVLDPYNKLAVLRVLMEDEDLAEYVEEQSEKENADENI